MYQLPLQVRYWLQALVPAARHQFNSPWAIWERNAHGWHQEKNVLLLACVGKTNPECLCVFNQLGASRGEETPSVPTEPQHPVRSAGMEAHRARGVLSQNRSVTPEELLIVPNYSWGWQASVGSSSSTGGTSTLGVLTWLLRCAAYPFASLSCFLCLHLFSRRHEARDSLSHFVSSEKMSLWCACLECVFYLKPQTTVVLLMLQNYTHCLVRVCCFQLFPLVCPKSLLKLLEVWAGADDAVRGTCSEVVCGCT